MEKTVMERLQEIDCAILQLNTEREALQVSEEEFWPKRITVYLHGSKEANYETGEELGLSEKALGQFVYACYEVGIDLDVYKDGTSTIVGVDGRLLQP